MEGLVKGLYHLLLVAVITLARIITGVTAFQDEGLD